MQEEPVEANSFFQAGGKLICHLLKVKSIGELESFVFKQEICSSLFLFLKQSSVHLGRKLHVRDLMPSDTLYEVALYSGADPDRFAPVYGNRSDC